MGEQRFDRIAVDSQGNAVRIIEWQGDHGTVRAHDEADLKDPQFYSRYTLLDGTTKLLLQPDNRTLVEVGSERLYTLVSR